MIANPILAEMVRGNWVENLHRGAICVSRADGEILLATGDVDRAIFPRSAIKAMQALAIFQSGAAEKFELSDEAIALACASHNGEAGHVAGVQQTLSKLGLTASNLECGAHLPTNRNARKTLAGAAVLPTELHNNCSGKHAGMLAVAKALDVPTKGYVLRDHPVQKLVRAGVEAVIGEGLTESKCGTDGCSIPTWAAPLKSFATGFARMATGEGLSEDLANASRRIFDAATSHPFLVRGTESLDTDLMGAFGGRLMIKIGAEGVFCGALRDSGLGFSLKIDDGNMAAAEIAVANFLLAVSNPSADEKAALEKYTSRSFSNWRKIEVATLLATDAARVPLN